LVNQIIVDKEFGRSIIDVIETNYFENKYFKIIIQMIKEYYLKYEHTPTFDTLEQITKSELQQELASKIVLDTITKIKDSTIEGGQFVQEKALKFCKQQELQKAITKAQKVIDGGEFENYDTLEQLIKEALQVGEREDGMSDVFSNLDDVLNEDYRHPIPMGIPGIDRLLKGGLAKGEIGVILAPTGVGKSTFLTKISNHAYNLGYGGGITIGEIVNSILKVTGETPEVIWDETKPTTIPFRAVSTERIQIELGFKPTYTFEEGIKETIEWYIKNKK
jgi:replicative DNA helicase